MHSVINVGIQDTEEPRATERALSSTVNTALVYIITGLNDCATIWGCTVEVQSEPSSLSNEVQISWNGPSEHDKITERLLEDSLKDYFEEHTKSGKPGFYVSSGLCFSSSTVSAYMNKSLEVSLINKFFNN